MFTSLVIDSLLSIDSLSISVSSLLSIDSLFRSHSNISTGDSTSPKCSSFLRRPIVATFSVVQLNANTNPPHIAGNSGVTWCMVDPLPNGRGPLHCHNPPFPLHPLSWVMSLLYSVYALVVVLLQGLGRFCLT